jgi:hypothetical protein
MKPVWSFPAVSLALFALVAPALSAEPKYIDDRSDAASLIRSYYNAINRREYARAWDYFGQTKPSADFATFVKGFEHTDRVDVVTGAVSSEGAAGSTFFNIPVAIAAFGKDGGEQVFAGCFTARLANPQIQEPPFTGLHLEGAKLAASEQPYEEKLPASCGDGPPPEPVDAQLALATRIFATAHAGNCSAVRPDGETDPPEAYEIKFHYSTSGADEPESTVRLFRFYCGSGAYNEGHIYYLFDEIEGVHELQFASPELDVRYVNDDHEGKVESVNIIGYTTDAELVNSFYDEASKSITSYAKWRGVGDASSSGTYIFRDGRFSLVKYDVDASYDGEMNPETILDYNSGP